MAAVRQDESPILWLSCAQSVPNVPPLSTAHPSQARHNGSYCPLLCRVNESRTKVVVAARTPRQWIQLRCSQVRVSLATAFQRDSNIAPNPRTFRHPGLGMHWAQVFRLGQCSGDAPEGIACPHQGFLRVPTSILLNDPCNNYTSFASGIELASHRLAASILPKKCRKATIRRIAYEHLEYARIPQNIYTPVVTWSEAGRGQLTSKVSVGDPFQIPNEFSSARQSLRCVSNSVLTFWIYFPIENPSSRGDCALDR